MDRVVVAQAGPARRDLRYHVGSERRLGPARNGRNMIFSDART